MATATVSEHRGTDVPDALKEALTPLLAYRDQVTAEEASLKDQYETKRAEREQVEKVLRSGEMIAPKTRKNNKGKEDMSDLIAPQPWPENPRSRGAIEKVIKAIESMDGKEFQISMIAKRTGCNRKTVERGIGVLRGEDRVRLLGKRPQIERGSTPGGAHAATFKEIR